MARPPSRQPTDGELEILKVLWEAGPAKLGAIHAALQESRSVAMTTVATVLKTMRAKGLVVREDDPRGHLWSANVSRRAAASGFLGKILNNVFDGSARRLVTHLLEDGRLDEKERREILDLLRKEAAKETKPATGTKETEG